MQLAVYRTVRKMYGVREDASGLRDYYFIAPAGLDASEAHEQAVSELYANQIVAMGDMIEMQHDYAGS